MKSNHLICTGAALAAMLVGSLNAEAGGSRRYYDTSRHCAPVVVHPPRGYCPPRVYPPVYYRPAIVSSGWGRTYGGCDTPVYRGYNTYNRGYVETHRSIQHRTYPVYPQPYCGTPSRSYSHGGYYSGGYRAPTRGVTIRF